MPFLTRHPYFATAAPLLAHPITHPPCPICLEPLRPTGTAPLPDQAVDQYTLSCPGADPYRHTYHARCLLDWLVARREDESAHSHHAPPADHVPCPVCRRVLFWRADPRLMVANELAVARARVRAWDRNWPRVGDGRRVVGVEEVMRGERRGVLLHKGVYERVVGLWEGAREMLERGDEEGVRRGVEAARRVEKGVQDAETVLAFDGPHVVFAREEVEGRRVDRWRARVRAWFFGGVGARLRRRA